MRHRVYGKHLGRDKNERTALFRSLVQSLLLQEKIETTESKAKSIKGLVDKIINQAKSPNTRRLSNQFIVNKKVQEKLEKDLIHRLGSRNSGYTSVVRLGRRLGDNASVVQMKLLVEESKKDTKEQSKDAAKLTKTVESKAEVASESKDAKASKSNNTRDTKSSSNKKVETKASEKNNKGGKK